MNYTLNQIGEAASRCLQGIKSSAFKAIKSIASKAIATVVAGSALLFGTVEAGAQQQSQSYNRNSGMVQDDALRIVQKESERFEGTIQDFHDKTSAFKEKIEGMNEAAAEQVVILESESATMDEKQLARAHYLGIQAAKIIEAKKQFDLGMNVFTDALGSLREIRSAINRSELFSPEAKQLQEELKSQLIASMNSSDNLFALIQGDLDQVPEELRQNFQQTQAQFRDIIKYTRVSGDPFGNQDKQDSLARLETTLRNRASQYAKGKMIYDRWLKSVQQIAVLNSLTIMTSNFMETLNDLVGPDNPFAIDEMLDAKGIGKYGVEPSLSNASAESATRSYRSQSSFQDAFTEKVSVD